MAVAAKKDRRGNRANLNPFQPGTRPVGRAKGTPNKISRGMKDAIVFAAEHSKHSKDGTLEGYLLKVADERMDLFVPLLGRLLPLQINAKTQPTTKIVYSTVEEVRQALIDRGLAPERCDLLLLGKVPQPLQPVEVLGDVENSDAELGRG
jgi:hypothetical protein